MSRVKGLNKERKRKTNRHKQYYSHCQREGREQGGRRNGGTNGGGRGLDLE